jgi:hypothetical protein
MKKISMVASALVLAGFAAACGEAVTEPAAAPGGAAFDGGLTLGSGHRSGSDTTGATTTVTSQDSGTERSGVMHGSGN